MHSRVILLLGCNNGGGGGNFSKGKQLAAKWIGTRTLLLFAFFLYRRDFGNVGTLSQAIFYE